jgi:hypothetical protein
MEKGTLSPHSKVLRRLPGWLQGRNPSVELPSFRGERKPNKLLLPQQVDHEDIHVGGRIPGNQSIALIVIDRSVIPDGNDCPEAQVFHLASPFS